MPPVPESVASLFFFDDQKDELLKGFKFKENVRQWIQPRVEAWKDDFPDEKDWPKEWDGDKELWKAAREKLYKLYELNHRGKADPDEVIGALFPQDSSGPAARVLRERMFPGIVGDSSSPRPSTAQAPAEAAVTTPIRESSPEGASTPKTTVRESPPEGASTPKTTVISRSREGDDASLWSDSPSRAPTTPSRSFISRIVGWATPNQPNLDRDPSPKSTPAADVSSSIDDSTHNDSGFSHEEHDESLTTIGRNTPEARVTPTIDLPKEASTQAPAQLSSSSPTRLESSSLDNSGISPAEQVTQTKEPRRDKDVSREHERSGQVRTPRARAPPRPGASRRKTSPSPRTAQVKGKLPEEPTATALNPETSPGSHPKPVKARRPPHRGRPPRENGTPFKPASGKGREDVQLKGQTWESSNSMQERLNQQQQQIAALSELIKNLSVSQPQQGQVLTRTKVKIIPTNYNRFYLPTGENKPVQLSKPQRAHRFPNFNPTQWFGDEKVRELEERMRGALDKNYLAINYLRPENFSQCSSIQTDLQYWFYIPDPDVTPSYVAARANGKVDLDGRMLADDGLPVNKRRYVWACAIGINKKNQLVLEMEGLDGRPFSRCRTTNDSTLITKFKDLTDDHNIRWATETELHDLEKEELWINRQLIGPDNGSVRPDRAFELIVWNAKEERPCFKWAPLAALQKRFGADVKEMIQNVAARKVDQPDMW